MTYLTNRTPIGIKNMLSSPIIRAFISTLMADKNLHDFNVKEILRIFNGWTNSIVGSWGISKIIYHHNRLIILKVSGLLHKGYVIISYSGGYDLFNLYFVSTRGTVKETIQQVYLEDMISIIDSRVERSNDMTDEQYRKKLGFI